MNRHKPSECLTSITFAKFNIAVDGSITNLTFTENDSTPATFRNILSETILATDKHWMPKLINGKPVKSKTIILPLIYQYEAGCGRNGKNNYDTTSNSILKFFNGEGDLEIEYILLKPLRIFSQT